MVRYFFLNVPKKILITLLVTLRPLLGPANCRFTITCGKYALQQLETQPLFKALWNICKRLVACSNPLHNLFDKINPTR